VVIMAGPIASWVRGAGLDGHGYGDVGGEVGDGDDRHGMLLVDEG